MRRFIISLLTCFIMAVSSTAAMAANISIIWTNPANNATGVDIAITDIWVQFNTTNLSSSTFTGGNSGRVSVNNGASYAASLVDNSSGDYIKIHLSAPLLYSTTYTVTINKNVADTSGNKLGTTQYIYFTTMAKPPTDTTPPQVLSTFPLNGATDVPLTVQISVTFSELMATTTINSTNITLLNTDSNTSVSGTVTLDANGKVAYFTPSSNLSSSTNYRVRVSPNVTDLAGNKLQGNANYDFFFKTMYVDTIPPTVTVVNPLSGATSVDPDTIITAKFSEAIDSSSISNSTFTVNNGVTGTVTYDPTTWTATFTPSASLSYGTNYTATITTAVTDLAGNHMTANKTWTFTTVSATPPPALTDYCQVPSFITNSTALKPNLLLVVDDSGSMYEFAYKSKPSGSCNYGTNCYDASYDSTVTYYGYFDNSQMYKYNSSGYFELDTAATPDKHSFYSGNFLNWLTMRRVDVIRKVLIGGKAYTRTTGTANYLMAAEDPDRDYYKTYNSIKYTIQAGTSTEVIKDTTNNKTYNVKISIGNQPPADGLVSNYSDRINFGIMLYNDAGNKYEDGVSGKDGGYLAASIGSSKATLISTIEGADPTTWTPLAETLYEAVRYFEAIGSAYNGSTSYSGSDPILKPCQKNFVMILTDGESTKDKNVPGTSFSGGTKVTDAYSFDVKTWMDKIATNEGYTSQKNTSANTDDGTYYLEGVAYYAHTTDLRSSTVGKNALTGTQSLTIYTVFAFDDSPVGQDLLKKTAKYGGFNDLDKTGIPFTDSTCDPATRGANTRNQKCDQWDKDGDGVPDTYFAASSGDQLAASLVKAFNDILARVSSGTAASILSNSEGSGANILQAMFYPKKYFDNQTFADWIGELHNLWYYVDPQIANSTVREDTDYTDTTMTAPHYLNLASDDVVDFYFDSVQQKTMAQLYQDLLGDGQPDVDTNGDGKNDAYTTVGSPIDPDNVKSLWRAGQRLFYRSPANRTLYTNLSGSLVNFNTLNTNQSTVWDYLMAANKTEADKIIAYIGGTDQPGYRSRTITSGSDTGVWKLGDIISSTPRLQSSVQLNTFNLPAKGGYNDTSYASFIAQTDYKNRGMVYVGANDGMLHAFRLGNLNVTPNMSQKATLSGSGLGEERWAFIPRNALPYLRYLGDINYTGFNHLYFVDGSISINDVSIAKPTACNSTTSYYDCIKDSANGTNWKTVLIGSMGLGGATKIKGSGCKTTTCVETPTLDPADNSKGLGYSSYFALDISNQTFDSSGNLAGAPTLLWEFSDPSLGFSTSGAAIVRISATTGGVADKSKNGHWYAVLASGPTGMINTSQQQFTGISNQPLTIFVIDLTDGTLKRKINTLYDGSQITNAFAGTITAAPIDTEKWNPTLSGNYQDNALYIGYTQNATSGGVLRLVTKEDPDPNNWVLSKVIDGVGPVITNISRLQDRNNHNLWLYFGTGRYFYPLDDLGTQRIIAGIKEPCYTSADTIDPACTTQINTVLSPYTSALVDQSNASNTLSGTDKGWYINLSAQDTGNSLGAERSITDPVALTNGALYFTTFQPSSDECGFGGNSYLWGVKYNSGLQLSTAQSQAKALVQVSTGSFEQIDLGSSLTARNSRRTGNAMIGKPPLDPPPIVTKANNKPVQKILHIQEQ